MAAIHKMVSVIYAIYVRFSFKDCERKRNYFLRNWRCSTYNITRLSHKCNKNLNKWNNVSVFVHLCVDFYITDMSWYHFINSLWSVLILGYMFCHYPSAIWCKLFNIGLSMLKICWPTFLILPGIDTQNSDSASLTCMNILFRHLETRWNL